MTSSHGVDSGPPFPKHPPVRPRTPLTTTSQRCPSTHPPGIRENGRTTNDRVTAPPPPHPSRSPPRPSPPPRPAHHPPPNAPARQLQNQGGSPWQPGSPMRTPTPRATPDLIRNGPPTDGVERVRGRKPAGGQGREGPTRPGVGINIPKSRIGSAPCCGARARSNPAEAQVPDRIIFDRWATAQLVISKLSARPPGRGTVHDEVDEVADPRCCHAAG